MQQNTVLWAVIVLVVAGGAFFLWNTQVATAPSGEEIMEENAMEESGANMEEGAVMEDGTITEEMMGNASEPVVISYTEEGYSPASVTISRGETVRFVNNAASEETWPASAVHPTHSVYPEKTAGDCLGSAFDACRGLKPGESWEFTFNEAGEWRYHDHVHASKTGVVIVQ